MVTKQQLIQKLKAMDASIDKGSHLSDAQTQIVSGQVDAIHELLKWAASLPD